MIRRVVLVLAAAAVLLAWTRAEAIPAFARKYKISCSTCHAPFPRLKPYGEEFAARGFRMADPTMEPSRAEYDVGDPLLKLVRELPLAVRIEGHAAWKQDAAAESDAQWPWVLKVLSGGPIGKKISYYFYALIEEGDVVGAEDAWIQFNDLFGAPLDLQVGQFQVCDPLFKRELRLLRTDYEILSVRPGDSQVGLTYDRGLLLAWHAPWKLDAVLQVVNGNGIDPAEGDDANFDRDNFKNVALRVVRPFKNVRVGAFGYFGRERGDLDRVNRVTYVGPDLVLDLGEKWQVSMEYLERRDDDPYFALYDGPRYKTRGGFAEIHFFPKGQDGRWVLTALYNKVRSDAENARREAATVAMNYLLARNLRLLVEGGRDIETNRSTASVGLIAAF